MFFPPSFICAGLLSILTDVSHRITAVCLYAKIPEFTGFKNGNIKHLVLIKFKIETFLDRKTYFTEFNL